MMENLEVPEEPVATLRDQFAMAALPALISGRDWSHLKNNPDELVIAWSSGAYEVADGMLQARKK